MREDLIRFRQLAQECKDRAAEARSPADEDAWLTLAADWLALAKANEAAESGEDAPTGRAASG
ncbi:hypothetical protein ACVJGD_001433 [Bradyrhizobium sp. USDA 10063]